MQQAPRNFLHSILLCTKQQDLGGALAWGSQLLLGLSKIFLLAEDGLPAESWAGPTTCSSHPALPSVKPFTAGWAHLVMTSSLHNNLFCLGKPYSYRGIWHSVIAVDQYLTQWHNYRISTFMWRLATVLGEKDQKKKNPLYDIKLAETLICFNMETLYKPAAQLFQQQAELWPSPRLGSSEWKEMLYNLTL